MAFQKVYRESGEGAQASYDFVDLASGVGYQTFYGTSTRSSTAISYALITSVIPSAIFETFHANNGSSTLSFSTSPFNLPRKVSGTAFFSAGYASLSDVAGAFTSYSACLYKSDAAGTLSLLSASQAHVFSTTKTNFSQALFMMPCTDTIVKRGESVVLKVHIYTQNPGSGNYIAIGHDPSGNDGAYVKSASGASTVMKLNLPFRIDL